MSRIAGVALSAVEGGSPQGEILSVAKDLSSPAALALTARALVHQHEVNYGSLAAA